MVECHSRLLYLALPHAQRQDTLHRYLLHAFHVFQDTPHALVHANMRTAVLERQEPLVRCNEPFVAFLRPFHMPPIACQVAQPQETGQVEQGAMHSSRPHCWPLRTFRDLADRQAHAKQWSDQVANVRVHATTGEPPIPRVAPKAMRPVPALVPDGRETAQATVPTDFAMRFAGNPSMVPPWLIGQGLTGKADPHQGTCSFKDKPVATHFRCWQRTQRIELPQHREAAHKHPRRHWDSQEVAAVIS